MFWSFTHILVQKTITQSSTAQVFRRNLISRVWEGLPRETTRQRFSGRDDDVRGWGVWAELLLMSNKQVTSTTSPNPHQPMYSEVIITCHCLTGELPRDCRGLEMCPKPQKPHLNTGNLRFPALYTLAPKLSSYTSYTLVFLMEFHKWLLVCSHQRCFCWMLEYF